jgi:uncharacterized protein (TIGR00369 family)
MSDELDPDLREGPYPFQRLVGFTLTAWSDGFARIELPLAEAHMNRQGLPHGGLHATLLDTAMGYAGCYTGDAADRRLALTLSLTVNYLGQARGGPLRAEGRVTGGGRRTYFAEGTVRDGDGTPVASATGVFRLRSA